MPSQAPEPCPTCAVQPTLRRQCKVCGEGEWVIEHGVHYLQGALEVFACPCPSFHSALGRRKAAISQRRAARVKAGQRADWNRPVTTPEIAQKAAEGLARGLPTSRALREAGYPPSTARAGKLNRMIRAELTNLGKKYIKLGRDLKPEDQKNLVRGRLLENVILGTDKGVLSAKQLGADKRVAMWQPDSQLGLVVLQPPPVRHIRHEVPILPPNHPEEE